MNIGSNFNAQVKSTAVNTKFGQQQVNLNTQSKDTHFFNKIGKDSIMYQGSDSSDHPARKH